MPNGFFYNVISLVGMIILIFLNFISGNITNVFERFTKNKFLLCSFSAIYAISVAAYVFFYIHNVLSSNKHVRMIVFIQKSFLNLNFNQYNKIVFENWIYVLKHFLVYSLFFFLRLNIAVTTYFFSMVYFDVYASYSVCLIKLLNGGMLAWIAEIKYNTQVAICINDEDEKRWTKLLQVYTDLMAAFSIFKDVFQIPVIVIC